MGLALSTSWNAFRHRCGKAMLFEISKLGFGEIELSFNLTGAMLRDIIPARKELGLEVTSVHNFCPIPVGLTRKEALPDCFSMASLSQHLRRQAIIFSKRSIDTACSLGADAVILHCGRVDIPDRTKALIALYNRSAGNSGEFRKLKESIIAERHSLCRPFFENTLRSLEELEAYARKRGVKLGIENRIYYREIPTLEELESIFGRFKGSCLRYWHDTGHAQVMQELGFARHKDYLERYASIMAGIHLHDVDGCRDHLAPSKGRLDFGFLRKYILSDTIKVIEAHHPATAEDVIRGREYLERVFK